MPFVFNDLSVGVIYWHCYSKHNIAKNNYLGEGVGALQLDEFQINFFLKTRNQPLWRFIFRDLDRVWDEHSSFQYCLQRVGYLCILNDFQNDLVRITIKLIYGEINLPKKALLNWGFWYFFILHITYFSNLYSKLVILFLQYNL